MRWEKMYVGRIFPGYVFKFALDRTQIHTVIGTAANGDVVYETPFGQLERVSGMTLVFRGGRRG